MNTKPKPFDVISNGTLRDQDLLDACLDCLSEYRPHKYTALITEGREALKFAKRNTYYPKSKHWQRWQDHLSWLLNEDIFNAMQDIAPAGTSFGSHPGDGACLGFWPFDDSPLWE